VAGDEDQLLSVAPYLLREVVLLRRLVVVETRKMQISRS
jgi:hypothetical protein